MFASHIMNMKSESMKYTVKEKEKEWIRREVHHLYHDCDVNCASTMLHCLSYCFPCRSAMMYLHLHSACMALDTIELNAVLSRVR